AVVVVATPRRSAPCHAPHGQARLLRRSAAPVTEVPLSETSASSKRLPWVMPPAVLPIWYAGVAWSWWRLFHHDLLAAPPAPHAAMPSSAVAATVAVGGKLLGHLSEAA